MWESRSEVEFRLYDLKKKQPKSLPGTHWPIHPPGTLTQTWAETVAQLSHSYPEREWVARFAQWLWELWLIRATLGSVWSQARCMAHGGDLQPLSPPGRDAAFCFCSLLSDASHPFPCCSARWGQLSSQGLFAWQGKAGRCRDTQATAELLQENWK